MRQSANGEAFLTGATDSLQVPVNGAIVVKTAKPTCNPDRLVGVEFSKFAGMENMGPYNSHAINTGVLTKVLQEMSVRHPWENYAQLGNVGTGTSSRQQVGVVQSLPRSDLLVIPLVGAWVVVSSTRWEGG